MRLTLGFSWLALVAATNNTTTGAPASNVTTSAPTTPAPVATVAPADRKGANVQIPIKKALMHVKATGSATATTTTAAANTTNSSRRVLMEVRDLSSVSACGDYFTALWVSDPVGRDAMVTAAQALVNAAYTAFIPATATVTAGSYSSGACNDLKINYIKFMSTTGNTDVTMDQVTAKYDDTRIKDFVKASANAATAAIDNIVAKIAAGGDAAAAAKVYADKAAKAMGYTDWAAGGNDMINAAKAKTTEMTGTTWLNANSYNAADMKANTVAGTGPGAATTTTAPVSGANQVAVLLVAAAGAFFALF